MNDFIQMAETLMRENAELKAANAEFKAQLERYEERMNEVHTVSAPEFSDATLREIITPLIEKYDDKTVHNVSTFRRVYNEMNVDWGNEVVKCIKKYNLVRIPHKAYIVAVVPELKAEFERCVHVLLTQ